MKWVWEWIYKNKDKVRRLLDNGPKNMDENSTWSCWAAQKHRPRKHFFWKLEKSTRSWSHLDHAFFWSPGSSALHCWDRAPYAHHCKRLGVPSPTSPPASRVNEKQEEVGGWGGEGEGTQLLRTVVLFPFFLFLSVTLESPHMLCPRLREDKDETKAATFHPSSSKMGGLQAESFRRRRAGNRTAGKGQM